MKRIFILMITMTASLSSFSMENKCDRQIDAQLKDYSDPHYSKEDIKKLIENVMVFGKSNNPKLSYSDCGSSNYINIEFNAKTCVLEVESSDSDGECDLKDEETQE